jgi:hypothetical protein
MARSLAHKDLDPKIIEARRYRDKLNVLVDWHDVLFEFAMLPARLGPWMVARTRGKKLPNGVGLPDTMTLLAGILAHDNADWSHVPPGKAPLPKLQPAHRKAQNTCWQAQIADDNRIWHDPAVQQQSGISPYVGIFLATYLNDPTKRADFLIGLDTIGNTGASTYDKDKLEQVRLAFKRYQIVNCGPAFRPIRLLAIDINAKTTPGDRWGICDWYGCATLLRQRGIDAAQPEGARLLAACIAVAEPTNTQTNTHEIDANKVDIIYDLLTP